MGLAALLHTTHPCRYASWSPRVLPVSAHSGRGVQALAAALGEFLGSLGGSSGVLAAARRTKAREITWLHMQVGGWVGSGGGGGRGL